MPTIEFHSIIAGEAQGPLVVLSAPVSFWGGVDEEGTIIDPHHPNCGQTITSAILVMSPAKGSTAGPGALLERLVDGSGPNAILVSGRDMVPIIASNVAGALNGTSVPVGFVEGRIWHQLRSATQCSETSPSAHIRGNCCVF